MLFRVVENICEENEGFDNLTSVVDCRRRGQLRLFKQENVNDLVEVQVGQTENRLLDLRDPCVQAVLLELLDQIKNFLHEHFEIGVLDLSVHQKSLEKVENAVEHTLVLY